MDLRTLTLTSIVTKILTMKQMAAFKTKKIVILENKKIPIKMLSILLLAHCFEENETIYDISFNKSLHEQFLEIDKPYLNALNSLTLEYSSIKVTLGPFLKFSCSCSLNSYILRTSKIEHSKHLSCNCTRSSTSNNCPSGNCIDQIEFLNSQNS